MRKSTRLIFLTVLLVIGCRKNPIERLTNPVPGGAVPLSSGVFTIYDDELKTGGGLALIPAGGNQLVDLSNRDNPVNAGTQVKYIWNGQPVGGQQLFAGVQFLITPDGSTLSAATAKNLSTPGYTTLKMKLRGVLSTANTLRIEGPSDGFSTAARLEIAGPDLSASWQDVTLTIPSVDFTSVKIFATFSIQYAQPPRTTAPGNGGVIYIDDLRYEK